MIVSLRRWVLRIGLGALVSCSSDPVAKVRLDFAQGNYQACHDELTRLKEDDDSNAHVYLLDRGVVSLALADPRGATQDFRFARDRLDDLEGTDFAGWFGSVLLDDRQLKYQGYDYEKVMVRAMLALSDLMTGNAGDAGAFALQVAEKQQEIIESFRAPDGSTPKESYKLVAFGSYLRGIIDEERLRFDTAKRSFERVKQIEPGFAYIDEDLRRVTEGHHSQKGNGVVHVIGLVGRAPFRVEADEPVTQVAMGIAQLAWEIARRRAILPNFTSVKIPALAFYQDNPTEIHVEVGGAPAGVTATVTDVEQTALEEFEAMKAHIIARAVVRRAFKIAVTEGVKEAARPRNKPYRVENALLDLAISGIGILWTAIEGADLRCWSLLPARIQAVRIELPEGEHDILLRAGVGGQPAGPPQSIRVLVRDGFNTYVTALSPTTYIPPSLLSSDRVEREPAQAEPVAPAPAALP